MISIVLTLSGNPLIAEKAIQSVLNNKIKERFELVVLNLNKRTEEIVNKFKKKNFKISSFNNSRKGKSFDLNTVFKILKGRIWIFTGGDAYVGEDSICKIINEFSDGAVGCAIGRPISINKKENMFGFWSHLLFEVGAHSIRKELNSKGKFLEGTDYLFAFKNNLTRNIPLNVAGDSIIPYLTIKKGYKVKYLEEAIVYVKNPATFGSFIKQKVDSAKSHEFLESYAPFFPKVKSFKNEVKRGTLEALRYSSNVKEFMWVILLFFIRLYIWAKVKLDTKILKKDYFAS
ncbi:MAG: glycosyltransferase family 2 protein [Nanoarchaeota archaeon]